MGVPCNVVAVPLAVTGGITDAEPALGVGGSPRPWGVPLFVVEGAGSAVACSVGCGTVAGVAGVAGVVVRGASIAALSPVWATRTALVGAPCSAAAVPLVVTGGMTDAEPALGVDGRLRPCGVPLFVVEGAGGAVACIVGCGTVAGVAGVAGVVVRGASATALLPVNATCQSRGAALAGVSFNVVAVPLAVTGGITGAEPALGVGERPRPCGVPLFIVEGAGGAVVCIVG